MHNMPTQVTIQHLPYPVSGECSTYGLAISDGSGKGQITKELIIFKHWINFDIVC